MSPNGYDPNDPRFYGIDPNLYPGAPQTTGDVVPMNRNAARPNQGILQRLGRAGLAGLGAGMGAPRTRQSANANLGRAIGGLGRTIYDRTRKEGSGEGPTRKERHTLPDLGGPEAPGEGSGESFLPQGLGRSSQAMQAIGANSQKMPPLGYEQYVMGEGPAQPAQPIVTQRPTLAGAGGGGGPIINRPSAAPQAPKRPARPINPNIGWNPPATSSGRPKTDSTGTTVDSTISYPGLEEPQPPQTPSSGGATGVDSTGTTVDSGINYPGGTPGFDYSDPEAPKQPGDPGYNINGGYGGGGSGQDNNGIDTLPPDQSINWDPTFWPGWPPNTDVPEQDPGYSMNGGYGGGGGGGNDDDPWDSWRNPYDYEYAQGGRVNSEVVARIGEDEPEDVVPQSKALQYAQATIQQGTPPDPSTLPAAPLDMGNEGGPPALKPPGDAPSVPSTPTQPTVANAGPPATVPPAGMGAPPSAMPPGAPVERVPSPVAAPIQRAPQSPQLPTAPPVREPKLWRRIAAAGVGAMAGISNARGGAPQIDPSGAAQQILYPGRAREMADYKAQVQRVKDQAKLDMDYENTAGLKEQREGMAEQRRADSKTRAAQAAEKERADRAGEKSKVDAAAQKRYEGFIKGQEDSVVPLRNGEQAPPGWQVIDNPDGYQVAIPPAVVPLPKGLVEFIPGKNEGDRVSHREYREALKMYQETLKGKSLQDNKTLPKGTPEQQFLDEYKVAHPGSTIAQAQAAYVKNSQAPERPDKPSKTLMMVPDGKGGLRAMEIKPGDAVPEGAVNASGLNSQNVATAATRTMKEAAPKVMSMVDRVSDLVDKQATTLGPLSSRWAEYMAGKVGAPNPEFTKLRTDVGLLSTMLMRMHVGARGGTEMMTHFKDLIDVSKQSPENLKAALGAIKEYADEVAGHPQQKQQQAPIVQSTGGRGNPASGGTVKWGRDAQGNPVPLK